MSYLAERLDALAESAARDTLAPSLSVAVVEGGDIVYARAFGAANAGTVYNIASLTKQFTAACMLLLQREGRLSLDEPVSTWFPELTRAGDITIRHLLSHSSGYADYYPLGYADSEKAYPTPPEEIVRRYATRPLQFEPGTMWSYSNTGYHLAGLIIERVTGKRFQDVLAQTVLQPAGMASSYFDDPPRIQGSHARGYTRYCLGPQREASPEQEGWLYASGGIASTAGDLARWHTVLMTCALLSQSELLEMTTPYALASGEPSASALGWFVEQRGDHRVILHNGGIAGFASQTIVSLDRRCSVAVLANADHVPTGAIATRLLEAVLPGATPPTPAVAADPEPAETAARGWLSSLASGDAAGLAMEPELRSYLDEGRLNDAREGLTAAGALDGLALLASGERGGMAWHRVQAQFRSRKADVFFRQANSGALSEFNVFPMP